MHYTTESGQRKLSAVRYLSRIRMCGRIILAPLISDEYRRQLQQYKQKAIEIERKRREQKWTAVEHRESISAISSFTGDATVHVQVSKDSVDKDEDCPLYFSGEQTSSVGINSLSSSYALEENQCIPEVGSQREGAVVKNTGNDSSLAIDSVLNTVSADDSDFSSSLSLSETVLDKIVTHKSIDTDHDNFEFGDSSSKLQQRNFTVEQNNFEEGQTNGHIMHARLERQRTFIVDTESSTKPKNDNINKGKEKCRITENQNGLIPTYVPPIHVTKTGSLYSSYENLSGADDCEISTIPAELTEIRHHYSYKRAVKVAMERLEERHRRELHELKQRQKCEKYLVLQYIDIKYQNIKMT